ncbi:hypothetical protein J5J83_07715 [Azoarcus sp. L1K30]|uniref:hypothetical protein n=1 Tax=Azoarcus sp. L1K30 TaxID=2820277 RepID=UPI001B80F560|nr:hypothetical protein [Azoarcus sp. L1K30]MBR0565998.1 hypothetical protein [Azoarcus sp. L1K30]
MNLLATILDQIGGMRMPLYAVTVTVARAADTPALLMLHWHGFRRTGGDADPQAPMQAQSVPGSALQFNTRWLRVEEIEAEVLDAAWQMGAWDMERRDRRGCETIGASSREALECRQAFGDNPFKPGDEAHLIAEAPDRGEMLRVAARKGYVRWQFRPVRDSLWRTLAVDDTLEADGSRKPPCPVSPRRLTEPERAPEVYRLGRIDHIILPSR